MQQETKTDYEMRTELLKTCLEKGMSCSMIADLTNPLRGKSEAEKEALAAGILETLKQENGHDVVTP